MIATPREILSFLRWVWVTPGTAWCPVTHMWRIKKPDPYAFKKKKPSVRVEHRAGGHLHVWEARVECPWHRAVASKKKMLRHLVSPKRILLIVLLDLFKVIKMTNFNYDLLKVSKMTNFNFELFKVSKMTNYSYHAFLWLKNF